MMVANKSWIVPLIISAVLVLVLIAIVAVAVVFVIKAKKQNKDDADDVKKPDADASVKKPPSIDKRILVEGIKANARCFNGLYEGIHNLAFNKNNDADTAVLSEWKERVAALNEDEQFRISFAKAFAAATDTHSELSQKAALLAECITLAGVERSTETIHTVDGTTAVKYICITGKMPEKGTQCQVIRPYWHINETVIEQGFLK